MSLWVFIVICDWYQLDILGRMCNLDSSSVHCFMSTEELKRFVNQSICGLVSWFLTSDLRISMAMRYLPASLLDKMAAVLDVEQQIGVGVVQNADGLVDEQVREHVLHAEGHVQDVRHLWVKKTEKRKESLVFIIPQW